MYGHDVPVLIASFLGMAYRSLPGQLVRYVIIQDPQGSYRTDVLLCTDQALPAADVVAACARRWHDFGSKRGFDVATVERLAGRSGSGIST